MTIQTIDTGFLKLDGGAMYGVVPKSIWQRLNPSDDRNLCTWAMRCLLIETAGRLVLVDTGLGTKQDEKFFSYYQPHGEATLLSSIKQAGYSAADITDVLLTHLHFDHVGGAVERIGEALRPTFPNAIYWSHPAHWDWALNPNPREKASFLKENILPIRESGQLKFFGNDVDDNYLGIPGLELVYVDGHTEKMALPKITVGNKTVLYCADLIPSVGHVPLPYVMSYDVRPLLTMDEKARLLSQAAAEGWILIFEHDPAIEAAIVEQTDRGIRVADTGKLADFL
ncbi:MBL fold metallo-hydrolase [Fibrella sp. HMF5335]|uniref:MBL fold metallo-hydrolase n=1 Tax=Fibrella rubiginis TaxID=2817060 RepID=A0A939K1K2_9BACT|nr:MBL fold metallo-hydrolase [Fibrella rubiginis]MBO0935334.1 MBL fold metallo-hydrolase [Fibrella rubiginis]